MEGAAGATSLLSAPHPLRSPHSSQFARGQAPRLWQSSPPPLPSALQQGGAQCPQVYHSLHQSHLFIWLCLVVFAAHRLFRFGMRDLVPSTGIKSRPPALGAWSLSHWTIREIPSPILTTLRPAGVTQVMFLSRPRIHLRLQPLFYNSIKGYRVAETLLNYEDWSEQYSRISPPDPHPYAWWPQEDGNPQGWGGFRKHQCHLDKAEILLPLLALPEGFRALAGGLCV